MKPTNKYRLAPVRIIKEEGKDGECIAKSRPRRRSTLKKSKVTNANPTPVVVQERRRSKRLLEGALKRDSKEINLSAFKPISEKKKETIEETPVPLLAAIPLDEKKEEPLMDDECNSLKIPSIKDFNISNISNNGHSKMHFEDKLSDSSLSNKLSLSRCPINILDNITDNGIMDFRNDNEKLASRKQSLTDYFSKKGLSAAHLFLHNHYHRQQHPLERLNNLNPNIKRSSLRRRFPNINHMKNKNMNMDRKSLLKSMSQTNNQANNDLEFNRESPLESPNKNEPKLETNKNEL